MKKREVMAPMAVSDTAKDRPVHVDLVLDIEIERMIVEKQTVLT
jgi:hypothetical protein